MPTFTPGVYPQAVLLPDGEYEFKVERANERLSRSDNEMIALKLSIHDPASGKCVDFWTQLVFVAKPSCIKLIDDFLTATGTKLVKGKPINLSAKACEGRVGWLVLGSEEFEGTKKNKVKKYIRKKLQFFVPSNPAAQTQAKTEVDPDAQYYAENPDDIPF